MAAYSSSTISGKPRSGKFLKGDTFTDSGSTVWECTESGYPGKWVAIPQGLTAAELDKLDGLEASQAELDRVADVSTRLVAGGSSLTLTAAAHDGKTVLLDTAAGTTITLPAATGSGARFRLVVSVAATSNQHRINVVGNDAFFGTATLAQDGGDTSVLFEAGTDADQINLNGTTTGGTKGATVELEDIATDVWAVRIVSAATGTEATPFTTGAVS
ncbi:MAG TPA: hypothetical protein VD931_22795 [Baekduia sp.]|nr:hypothetical protein [Baekduia sp.]